MSPLEPKRSPCRSARACSDFAVDAAPGVDVFIDSDPNVTPATAALVVLSGSVFELSLSGAEPERRWYGVTASGSTTLRSLVI